MIARSREIERGIERAWKKENSTVVLPALL
jgi:hypothetical protein